MHNVTPTTSETTKRRFLFLQGPHGPFFHSLAKMLRQANAEVWRVGFNAGDRAFWFGNQGFIPFKGLPEDWPDAFRQIVADLTITDLVLYGDVRRIHAEAIQIARDIGLAIHVFEEGYLRPYWVTYERDGTNGHSRLMRIDLPTMRKVAREIDPEVMAPPALWGDLRQHMFYGALYHWFVMCWNRPFRNFRPHRAQTVFQEFRLYVRRLMLSPLIATQRSLATRRVKRGGFPYHLCLLQLEHDSSFAAHGPFATMRDFLDLTISGFASGAPPHHHLVFKAHPLEDGRTPQRHEIRKLARQYGVKTRVHYVRGGKLAPLLNQARTAITVNSTAAQQVLWRGLPLKVFGQAVYDKPEFVSRQALPEFFARPTRPDSQAYRQYRKFLLETSQVSGGFYSARGRRILLRQIVDLMLADQDPYDALLSGNATPRQQLHIVR